MSWARAINRDQFKATKSTKVCSNHFVKDHRTPKCPTPTLYMRGYDSSKTKRPAPKLRLTENKENKSRKRRQSDTAVEVPPKKVPLVEDESLFGENIDFEHPALLSSAGTDPIFKVDVDTQTENKSPKKEKRDYFIEQATCPKNCYRYTGVTRSKLYLVFD